MTKRNYYMGFSNEMIADLEAVKLAVGAKTRPEAIRALLRNHKQTKENNICAKCGTLAEEAKE
jgi:hypothetical protein